MKLNPSKDFGIRECPSCACEVAANNNRCPICGYEFPSRSDRSNLFVWLVAIAALAAFLAMILL